MTTGTTIPRERTLLSVGTRCWLLLGDLLYVVDIVEVSTHLEGEPSQFSMYRVKGGSYGLFYEKQDQHRSDLFRLPQEREALFSELRSRMSRIRGYLELLDDAVDPSSWELGLQ